jgi:methyl-accepting chemotaxis protein
MRWFLNLPIRTKLFVSFGLLIVFLAAVVATAYAGMSSIRASQREILNEDFSDAVDLQGIRRDINGSRASFLGMMLLTDQSELEDSRLDIETRTANIGAAIVRLRERNSDDTGLLSRLQELEDIWRDYVTTRDEQMIPAILQGDTDFARSLFFGSQDEKQVSIRALADELGQETEDQAREALAASERSAQASIQVFVTVGFLALGTALGSAAYLDRIMSGPLRSVSEGAGRVARGDLTVDIGPGERTDEVGVLGKAFRQMVTNLREVTREIREGINVLAASSTEILSAATQVASGAAETATAISQTTTTVEEVRQAAQLSTQKARHVSDSSQKAAQIGQSGKQAVEDTVSGMNRIQQQMEAVAQSVITLSERGQAIGELNAVVNDLADQSNLLSVNASIEAAKAGEHGKGFSVVAQEIKNLAEQAKQATAQVRGILGDIQRATSAAVMATEQGSKAVEAGVTLAAEAGESIRLLVDSATEAAQAAIQILASSQQQTAGMDQVTPAMENIRQASAQNAASTKQAEVAALSLHELGLKLKLLADRFTV